MDTDQLLAPLRGIKSQSEIAVICRAYEIANAGMQAAIAAVRPGITERKIAAEAEYVMRKMGCEGYGIDPIVSSGPNAAHVLARTTTRVIEENDIVVITLAPRYEGYHGACGRTVLVGNPGEKAEKAVKAMIRAQNLCAENLVPGNIGSRVEEMGRQVMKEAGYEKNFMYSGLHSVGVIEFEPPIFGPSSSTVIEKDMVISIDIPLFEADVSGMRLSLIHILQQCNDEEITEDMDAILTVDTTKGNRVINHKGFAISPTVKEGYILRISEDLLDIVEITTGKAPYVFPITTPVSYTHLDVYKRQGHVLRGALWVYLHHKPYEKIVNS